MKLMNKRIIGLLLAMVLLCGIVPMTVLAEEEHIHTYSDGICTGCGTAQPGPVITRQPVDCKAKMGEAFCVTVEADGEGLKYQWYVKEFGTTTWIKSSITDNTYDTVMTDQRAGRQIYCVITDANGKSVTTNTVQLVLLPFEPTRIWEQWTRPVTMAAGTYPTYGGDTTGYYSKGQTFSGILYSSTMRDGRDVLWNLNSSTYYSAVANPASLLYTTDYRGRVFNESAWAGSVCSTTALKACGYAYPYTTTEIPMKFDEKTDHSIDNLEFGDILWTKGHVAGVVGVIKDDDGHVTSVKIIEQASYVRVFEITAQNWDTYFSGHWTHIYRGDFDETRTAPEEYPENLSIIFERGNNTCVTDCKTMLFYIPTATTVYATKDGVMTSYDKAAFPARTVNGVTVYDLASLFSGIGDYYFHTEENATDICIKVIDMGSITISDTKATLHGYENCEILGYRIIKILDEAKSSAFNFFEAPEGYTSEAVKLSFQWLSSDTFAIENIPGDTAGWKLEVYYDTGCGWARSLSRDIIYGEEPHAHTYTPTVTPPTCTEQGYTTYTCACGDSYVADYVEARGYDWMLEDGEFNLLLIGNSFSEDASSCGQGMQESQLLNILQTMLGEDVKVTVGLCYSGGKGLNWHATQSEQGNSSYSLRVISSEGGKWKSMGSYTSANALGWTDWDVVTLQHYELNTSTGEESNAYPEQVDPKFHKLKAAAEFMLDHVDRYAPDAEVYFYTHWSRAYASKLNDGLAAYNQRAAFIPEVLEYAGPETAQRFETIIPVGLSVQNARTTYLALLAYNTTAYADKNLNLYTDAQIGLQRDGGHLSFNIGRYIAGLTFAETIIPEELRADGYVLPDIRITESVGRLPKAYTVIAQKAVLAAVDSWKNGSLAVTTIEGYEADPTVDAGKTLQSSVLEIACAANAEALTAEISRAVLEILPDDFAVDAVSVPEGALAGGSFICDVTIRFGYTSLTVAVDCKAAEHTYENGICTGCGEAEPGYYIPGDINGDGSVNNKDFTRLFQYLADWDVEVVEAALDVNGDGSVNNKDLTRLFQYLSDWDVEIF